MRPDLGLSTPIFQKIWNQKPLELHFDNDAQYARAVDNVAKAAGDGAKTALLSRDTKVTKQDAIKLGEIAQSNSQTARNVLEQNVRLAIHPSYCVRVLF